MNTTERSRQNSSMGRGGRPSARATRAYGMQSRRTEESRATTQELGTNDRINTSYAVSLVMTKVGVSRRDDRAKSHCGKPLQKHQHGTIGRVETTPLVTPRRFNWLVTSLSIRDPEIPSFAGCGTVPIPVRPPGNPGDPRSEVAQLPFLRSYFLSSVRMLPHSWLALAAASLASLAAASALVVASVASLSEDLRALTSVCRPVS